MSIKHRASLPFCDHCGSYIKPPLYYCERCGRARVVTGSELIQQLRSILRGERKAEIEGKGKDVAECEVEAVQGNLVTMESRPPIFDEGDVLAVMKGEKTVPLGIVIEGGRHVLLSKFERVEVRLGDVLKVREAEQLVSYELQLQLLEDYESGALGEVEKLAFNIFFESALKIGEGRTKARDYTVLAHGGIKAGIELDEHQRTALDKILGLKDGELLLIVGPHVQFLRSFRDNFALKTFAGSKFMDVFNAWYYSFSPSVASFISTSEALRAVTRAAIYPLIGILHLGVLASDAFSFNSEVSVIVAGLVISALIGLVYFTPPTLLVLYLVGRWRGVSGISRLKPRLLLMPLAVSALLVATAELTLSPVLMMIGSGALVLSTIALVTWTVALKVTTRFSAYHGPKL